MISDYVSRYLFKTMFEAPLKGMGVWAFFPTLRRYIN